MHATALVLFSGGQDSTTCLADALSRYERVETLGFEYGQRHRIEMDVRHTVRARLREADMFCLPSFSEGLPVSIMEAMAAGLPVVATAVGGVPEAVVDGETGLLVAPRDAPALASALLRLARNPEVRAAMATRARVRSRVFDIRTAVEAQQTAYAELVTSRRDGPVRAQYHQG